MHRAIASILILLLAASTALAEVSPLDSVQAVPRGTSMYAYVANELRQRDPARIAVNSSRRNIADGLSWTQRNALEEALGPELTRRLVSSEDVVVEWLSVKLRFKDEQEV